MPRLREYLSSPGSLWALFLGALLVGVLLMCGGNALGEVFLPGSLLLLNLGALFIASVPISLVFQYVLNRQMVAEVVTDVNAYHMVKQQGIGGVWTSFQERELDWDALFNSTQNLTVFVAYGQSWRNQHRRNLERLLRDPGATLRVILPDYRDRNLMAQLASRFDESVDAVVSHVTEAIDDYRAMAASRPTAVEVLLFPERPMYTLYRFDSACVLASYRHAPGRGEVLTLLVRRPGEVFDWIDTEIAAMQGVSVPAPSPAALVPAAAAAAVTSTSTAPGNPEQHS